MFFHVKCDMLTPLTDCYVMLCSEEPAVSMMMTQTVTMIIMRTVTMITVTMMIIVIIIIALVMETAGFSGMSLHF